MDYRRAAPPPGDPTLADDQLPADTAADTGAGTAWAPEQAWNAGAAAGLARARVSAWAVLGLILSVLGVCAMVSGLLAPEGAALGLLGVLASLVGLVASSRPGVAGRGTALLGLLLGLATVVLVILARSGQISWPNGHTDQVARWHGWLVAHWSLLRRW